MKVFWLIAGIYYMISWILKVDAMPNYQDCMIISLFSFVMVELCELNEKMNNLKN